MIVTPLFSKSSLFQLLIFLSIIKHKTGVFKFLQVEQRFRKTPFSWRIRVQDRHGRRNKAAFSKFSGVVRYGSQIPSLIPITDTCFSLPTPLSNASPPRLFNLVRDKISPCFQYVKWFPWRTFLWSLDRLYIGWWTRYKHQFPWTCFSWHFKSNVTLKRGFTWCRPVWKYCLKKRHF